MTAVTRLRFCFVLYKGNECRDFSLPAAVKCFYPGEGLPQEKQMNWMWRSIASNTREKNAWLVNVD